jgi:hypothetical protein
MDGRRWTVERLQTADGVGQAFEAARERQTVNEWGNESTNAGGERRRQRAETDGEGTADGEVSV